MGAILRVQVPIMKEQNGNLIIYESDKKMRNIRTIYEDGKETFENIMTGTRKFVIQTKTGTPPGMHTISVNFIKGDNCEVVN